VPDRQVSKREDGSQGAYMRELPRSPLATRTFVSDAQAHVHTQKSQIICVTSAGIIESAGFNTGTSAFTYPSTPTLRWTLVGGKDSNLLLSANLRMRDTSTIRSHFT
jgi:hypothetical protein